MSDERRSDTGESDANAGALQRRLRSAIEMASGYRPSQEDDAQDASEDGVRPLEEWGDLVSQRIEDAMRQGLFDNLSGHGKPLNLERDPFLPEDQQMTATLLRNNRLSPAWISDRKAILEARERLRADLRTTASTMRGHWSSAQGDARRVELQRWWTMWLAGWRNRMVKLNDQILVHNLKQPVSHLEIYMLRLSDELARAEADPAWARAPDAAQDAFTNKR